MLLKDQVVLVTGGGRGIGAGIVRALSREGATVAVNYNHSKEEALAVAASVERAEAFQSDILDQDAVLRMVDDIYNRFGRIDGLINNAIAGRTRGRLEEMTWEDFATSFDYGAKAVINTIRAVRRIMKQQGGGRIVNIVSEQWNFGASEWSVYMAGKGAMVGISRSLADEVGPENITVNMVAPGWMKTEKVTAETNTTPYVESVPLHRQGDCEEIGNACVFFVSHLAAYVTGAYLPVAGGKVRQTGS